MIKVAGAIIVKEDRFLICQRPEGKKRGLLWEFPGGKLESGETGEEAIVREIREELGMDVIPVREYMKTVHDYGDIKIELTAYICKADGEPSLLEHRDAKWITQEETDGVLFCEADIPIVKKMKCEGLNG